MPKLYKEFPVAIRARCPGELVSAIAEWRRDRLDGAGFSMSESEAIRALLAKALHAEGVITATERRGFGG